MDYVFTYPKGYIIYVSSDMILELDSDAAYLIAPKARSTVAGYYHITEDPSITQHPIFNGSIHVECKTLHHGLSSAAEAEVGRVFHTSQVVIPIRTLLHALKHPQPLTSIKTDNSTAFGFIYDNMHQKRFKSWDMR